MYIQIVEAEVEIDQIQAFRKATERKANASNLEDDVLRFEVLQDSHQPERFVLIEIYKNENAVNSHKQTEHYLRWRDEASAMGADNRTKRYFNDVVTRLN